MDPLTGRVIGVAIGVHRELGPGLLESTYQTCMVHDLLASGLQFEWQKRMPITYKGRRIKTAYRIDLLIENELIVELKCIDRFEPVHTAQLLTYMKLSRCRTGLLINFKVPLLKDGIRRVVL